MPRCLRRRRATSVAQWTGTRSRDDLRPSFDRVAERYHHLRRQVDDRVSPYGDASLAFERVTEAYLDVDRAMNHPDSNYHN